MQTLLNDYRRRLATIKREIAKFEYNRPNNVDYTRLVTKAACYREIITEIEREIENQRKDSTVDQIEVKNIAPDNILTLVRRFDNVHGLVRDYLYPKLYTLYNEKKLNKGELPENRQAKDSVGIIDFGSDGEEIYVNIDIWWCGDNYDRDSVSLTCDEWDAIPNTL